MHSRIGDEKDRLALAGESGGATTTAGRARVMVRADGAPPRQTASRATIPRPRSTHPTVTETERLDATPALRRPRAPSGPPNGRFFGQEETIDRSDLALMAGGHVLLEGPPAREATLSTSSPTPWTSSSSGSSARRTRCPRTSSAPAPRVDAPGLGLDFEKGPVFTNVLLADEVNRATWTQSALLEAMQERQVTLHGTTHPLAPPFFMVATQNPIEMEGTYLLPEAQLDRFLFKLELQLPDAEDLTTILSATTGESHDAEPPSFSRAEWLRLQELVREVAAPSDLVRTVSSIVLRPTRTTSPRRRRSAPASATAPACAADRRSSSLRRRAPCSRTG